MVNYNFMGYFNNSFRFDKIADLHEIHAHILGSLQEFLFELSEELGCDDRLSTSIIFNGLYTTQLFLNILLLLLV